TGTPALLTGRLDDSTFALRAPEITIDQRGGVLTAVGGTELRMPGRFLASAVQVGTEVRRDLPSSETVLSCARLRLELGADSGTLKPNHLLAEEDVDLVDAMQCLAAQGTTLKLDLALQTGEIIGSEQMPAEIRKSTPLGRPLLTMRAPLILIEDSGKALRAPRLGSVQFWSESKQGRVDSERDLGLRENHVSARGDVHVWMQEEVAKKSAQSGATSDKDYLVCADTVDADLIGATEGALTIERLVASGAVRFTSGELRSRADQLTMQTRWWHP